MPVAESTTPEGVVVAPCIPFHRSVNESARIEVAVFPLTPGMIARTCLPTMVNFTEVSWLKLPAVVELDGSNETEAATLPLTNWKFPNLFKALSLEKFALFN